MDVTKDICLLEFNKGTIIQYGTIKDISVASGTKEFIYPISFKNVCIPVICGKAQALTWTNIASYTTTSCTVNCNNYQSQGRLTAYLLVIIGN